MASTGHAEALQRDNCIDPKCNDTTGVCELPRGKGSGSGLPVSNSIFHKFDDIVRDADLRQFLSVHKTTLTFPEALLLVMTLAEREAVSKGRAPEEACISWTSSGTAIIIRDKEELINNLLPIAYSKSKFSSFIRKLYRWGFRQLSGKPLAMAIYQAGDKAYWHPFFQRDNKPLAIKMRSMTAETRRLSESSQTRSQRRESTFSESEDQQNTSAVPSDRQEAALEPRPRPPVATIPSQPSMEQPTISSSTFRIAGREREQLVALIAQTSYPPTFSISNQFLAGFTGMPRFPERHAPLVPTFRYPPPGYSQLLQLAHVLPQSHLQVQAGASLTEGERSLLLQHFGFPPQLPWFRHG